jgi:hypothetical protein
MDVIGAIRVLRTHRLLVFAALLISVAIGVFACYKVTPKLPPKFESRRTEIGLSTAQVLIDTPQSQIADTNAVADDPGIYAQATLLADVMATAPVQQEISQALKLPPGVLVVTPPPSSIAVPIRASPLAVAGTALSGRGVWKLSVSTDPSLPIIGFSGSAPTVADAGRLVDEAMKILPARLDLVASAQHIPGSRKLVVNVIDPTRVGVGWAGARKSTGILVAVAVFFILLLAIILIFKRDAYAPDAGEPSLGHRGVRRARTAAAALAVGERDGGDGREYRAIPESVALGALMLARTGGDHTVAAREKRNNGSVPAVTDGQPTDGHSTAPTIDGVTIPDVDTDGE